MAQLRPQFSKTSLNIKGIISQLILSEYFILVLSMVSFIILIPIIPVIATPVNLSNLFSNIWPLLAIAIGQTFVLIIAGIDLSQGSIMAVVSVVGAMVMTNQVNPILFEKSPIWGVFITEKGGLLAGNPAAVSVALLVMLFTGTLIGFLNGFAIARFKIPDFMVTLVTQIFFSSIAIFLVKSENIIHLPDSFNNLGDGSLWLIPYSMLITVTLGIFAQWMLSRTVFGKWLYAVGTNIRASVISGVPTQKVIIMAYTFSGFCAAVGAILYSARLEGGRPTLGASLLLDIIGAAVIGGSSLAGGKGKVLWTLFGVIFLMLLGNALSLLNVPYFTIYIVKGGIILAAALLDVSRTRIMQRGG